MLANWQCASLHSLLLFSSLAHFSLNAAISYSLFISAVKHCLIKKIWFSVSEFIIFSWLRGSRHGPTSLLKDAVPKTCHGFLWRVFGSTILPAASGRHPAKPDNRRCGFTLLSPRSILPVRSAAVVTRRRAFFAAIVPAIFQCRIYEVFVSH